MTCMCYPNNIHEPFLVSTPFCESIIPMMSNKNYVVTIFHGDTMMDVVEFYMADFDMILDMDLLQSCYIFVDCRNIKVTFHFPNKSVFEWDGSPVLPKKRFIFYLRVQKMISKGYLFHLVWVKDSSAESTSLQSIPVVHEFFEVFPKDLL